MFRGLRNRFRRRPAAAPVPEVAPAPAAPEPAAWNMRGPRPRPAGRAGQLGSHRDTPVLAAAEEAEAPLGTLYGAIEAEDFGGPSRPAAPTQYEAVSDEDFAPTHYEDVRADDFASDVDPVLAASRPVDLDERDAGEASQAPLLYRGEEADGRGRGLYGSAPTGVLYEDVRDEDFARPAPPTQYEEVRNEDFARPAPPTRYENVGDEDLAPAPSHYGEISADDFASDLPERPVDPLLAASRVSWAEDEVEEASSEEEPAGPSRAERVRDAVGRRVVKAQRNPRLAEGAKPAPRARHPAYRGEADEYFQFGGVRDPAAPGGKRRFQPGDASATPVDQRGTTHGHGHSRDLAGNIQYKRRTEMMDDATRARHELSAADGKLRKADGAALDTAGAAKSGLRGAAADTYIYTVDAGGVLRAVDAQGHAAEINAGKTDDQQFVHHSSMTRGGDVLGAGGIVAKEGQVKEVTTGSGHYKPGEENLLYTLDHLDSLGVDLTTAKATPWTEHGSESFDATAFRKTRGDRGLMRAREQMLAEVRDRRGK